jgi:hypothetical protein
MTEFYPMVLIFKPDYFISCSNHRENTTWFGKWKGVVRPQFPFRFEQEIK